MLGARHVSQTPEQLLLRDAAAAANPEFATLEGRALQDVRDTISYLALGMRPKTVLGGLLDSPYFPFDATLIDTAGRDAIEVGVKGDVDPASPNERGDTVQDVLEGLVGLGIVERAFDPGTPDAALTPDDDYRKIANKPYYRLSTESLPPDVRRAIDSEKQRDAAYAAAESRRIAEKQERAERRRTKTKGIFKRQR